MPNFDGFERIFKMALVEPDGDLNEYAHEIYSLSEEQKTMLVKGRGESEIIDFLHRARFALRSYFPTEAQFETSSNNMDDNDLRELTTGTNVEVKSGPLQTAANSGLSTISWAIEDHLDKLKTIMADSALRRRILFTQGDFQGVLKSKSDTMDQLVNLLKSKLKVGDQAPLKLDHYVRCVALGHTNMPAIKSLYVGIPLKSPLLLQAKWAKGLEIYSHSYLPTEILTVSDISRTRDRAQLKVLGLTSRTETTIYPNYKNSWKSSSGNIKIPADNWVKNPCFNIFIN